MSREVLAHYGAVSAPVAEAMAVGARSAMNTDIAVSVTGLAGPSGDDFGNPVGTVYIGYASEHKVFSEKHLFSGDREQIRNKAVEVALQLICRENQK